MLKLKNLTAKNFMSEGQRMDHYDTKLLMEIYNSL
jgi:hypothetical protein